MKTETKQVRVDRWSVISSRSFDDILTALDAALGHPDIGTVLAEAEAGSADEMKAVIGNALGSSGFMEFIRFDPGRIIAKELARPARIVRFVIGNPLVMKEMVKHVPDAAAYAPVTILVVEEADSVRISYDTMASLLGHYESAAASEVAGDLDNKIKALVVEVASTNGSVDGQSHF